MSKAETFDFAIIGGGVVGLSIAWELSPFGRVVVIDRQQVGQEASWAGAGILPPASMAHAVHPLDKLSAESFRLHPLWAERLKHESGIDTGYRECGALYVARTAGEIAALSGQMLEWAENEIDVQPLTVAEVARHVPLTEAAASRIRKAAFVPSESQIRNPHHLRALVKACEHRGVHFCMEHGDCRFSVNGHRITAVHSGRDRAVQAARYCLAAGVWTGELCQSLGFAIRTVPVRGQMLLFRLPQRTFEPVVYEGTRYIVPRDDGHVVVGSTLEEAGFDKSTTPDGLDGLMSFAAGLVSGLEPSTLVKSWAGLRPASFDGFPYLGPAPGFDNLWVATAHFRSGLLQSTATAVVVGQLMRDQPPLFDLTPFRVDRG
jgi:glycine oxidase